MNKTFDVENERDEKGKGKGKGKGKANEESKQQICEWLRVARWKSIVKNEACSDLVDLESKNESL